MNQGSGKDHNCVDHLNIRCKCMICGRIKKLDGTHHDHGYRSDGCHEDSHFDLSAGIVFGFD